jgi:transcriptional regulator with PAS, ATPase and Fis domain
MLGGGKTDFAPHSAETHPEGIGVMGVFNDLNFSARLTVEQMMNRNFELLHVGDTLRRVVEGYRKYKVNTLPIVDKDENLVGVFPKKRLFKALLDGADLDVPCETYMVDKPVFVTTDRTYDEYSLVVRVTKSKVDNVVVLDRSRRVVGMIGTAEYLRESLNMITVSSALLESLFMVNAEGIIIVDRDERVLRANPAAEHMFGLKASEIKGSRLRDVLPEAADVDEFRVGIRRTVRSLPVLINRIPILENGDYVGASFAFLDVSDMEKIARELEIVKEMQTQVQYYRDELEKRDVAGNGFDKIVTVNPAFRKMKSEALFIARSSSTILLTGESGVGKDMFARCIHEASPRAKQPFVKVSCVSIPESLFESELFGYAPGSFTGALKNGKPGYFERAHRGTIFLDEIGDMPLSVQAKLLQVLQEKEFTRVGGTDRQTVDVRIIAATNRNLREAIANRTFREDLFYRLNVIEFHLPPLRERSEDTVALAESFTEKNNRIHGARVTGINARAKDALRAYTWPGNIRELENAIERAANYVWNGEIGTENLPSQIAAPPGAPGDDAPGVPEAENEPLHASYRRSLFDFEKDRLLDVLKKANGNKSAAARMLKLSRSAFYGKLAKYGLR